MISKNKILLIFGSFFAIRFYSNSPLSNIYHPLEAIFLVGCFLFSIKYFLFSNIDFYKSTIFEKYILFLIIFIPVYNTFVSSLSFQQPIIYSILSVREWFVAGFFIWLYDSLKSQRIDIKTLTKVFIFFAFFSVGNSFYYNFIFDINFLPEDTLLTPYLPTDQTYLFSEYRFKTNDFYTVFGLIFFFLKYSLQRKILDLIFLTIFFGNVLFVIQSRATLLSLFLTYIFFIFYRNFDLLKIAKYIFRTAIFIILFNILLFVLNPDLLTNFYYLFGEAFVVMTGEFSSDSSANSRIFQGFIMVNYVSENIYTLLFGVGELSNQFADGYRTYFGYLFPEDLGVFGSIFIFGIFGFLVIHLLPFLYSYKLIKEVRNDNIFIASMVYLLVFEIIRSIPYGSFHFQFQYLMFPISILTYWYNNQERIT